MDRARKQPAQAGLAIAVLLCLSLALAGCDTPGSLARSASAKAIPGTGWVAAELQRIPERIEDGLLSVGDGR